MWKRSTNGDSSGKPLYWNFRVMFLFNNIMSSFLASIIKLSSVWILAIFCLNQLVSNILLYIRTAQEHLNQYLVNVLFSYTLNQDDGHFAGASPPTK